MVYCGKASQGCQSCRTRRIKVGGFPAVVVSFPTWHELLWFGSRGTERGPSLVRQLADGYRSASGTSETWTDSSQCDKVQPQCTQCVRIRKQCPGYRDQLSLMFRDESTKVMQKAHAQWGVHESESGEASGSSPMSTASPTSTRSRSSESEAPSPRPTTLATRGRRKSPEERRLAREISPTPVDKAIQFYIQHYVIGLPDEARVGQELQGTRWIHARGTRDIMAAVGMAGLSNLNGDKQMSTLAKQHYGLALQNMSSSVRDMSGLDLDIVLRTVVMMAVYEVSSYPVARQASLETTTA